MFRSKINGEIKNKKVTAAMKLVVERFNEIDSVRYFLVTIVGYEKDEKNVAPFSYMGSRKNFEGYMVISSVEGEPLWAYYYKDGTRRYAHLHSSVKEKGDSDYMGFSLYSQGIATKSGSYSTGEGDEWCYSCHQYVNFNSGVCSRCGADPLYTGGGVFEDDGVYCPVCGNFVGQCICPEPCPYCGDPYCNGECQNYAFCTNCGSQLINGVCPNCSNNDDDSGGNQENPPPTPAQDTMYTISVEIIGNGTATGGGDYKKGDYTVLSGSESNSTFGGWFENNSLLSLDKLYPVIVTSSRCFKALFHDLNTDCSDLVKKYKSNLYLKSALGSLNSKRILNGNIEHAYTMNTLGVTSYFQGTASGVDNITFNSFYKYDCIVHNHLNTPIPSVEDIIALHQAYQKGSFQLGSYILMQTSAGTMSIEIENWEQFDSFVMASFADEESIDSFKKNFHKYILDNSSDNLLNSKLVIDKAINFYSKDKGLKIAFSEGDGIESKWSYAIQDNNTLTFKDCERL